MKLKLFSLIVVLMSAVSAIAQDLDALLKRDLDAERRTIVAQSIIIPNGMETDFWKYYSDMEQELDMLTDMRIANIKKFADNYENVTDKVAKDLAGTFFDINSDRYKIYKKYYKKMGKLITAKEAARLIQILNQIQLIIDVQLAAEVPLIE
ncbi:MAG: hypothetical protein ABFS32_00710 [Bacteroidota bacterium]